jgi:E3 ubiquitin-protein ligase HERC2
LTNVPVASGFGFCQLACGDDFSLLLTSNGNVLSTGSGAMGQHCMDGLKQRNEFLPVGSETAKGGSFDGIHVVQIAAGEAHCAALDTAGKVYLWGRNTYGECGEKPEILRVTSPRLTRFVLGEVERQFTMVACGGNHTLLLT